MVAGIIGQVYGRGRGVGVWRCVRGRGGRILCRYVDFEEQPEKRKSSVKETKNVVV